METIRRQINRPVMIWIVQALDQSESAAMAGSGEPGWREEAGWRFYFSEKMTGLKVQSWKWERGWI